MLFFLEFCFDVDISVNVLNEFKDEYFGIIVKYGFWVLKWMEEKGFFEFKNFFKF